ncbi:hypothetical protein CSUI_007939, partial [Cystoisospora suis]
FFFFSFSSVNRRWEVSLDFL